jgi:2,3-bisphosphoglycerate-independent phosphoglycerate mutase
LTASWVIGPGNSQIESDIAIIGYFSSVDEGSAAKRVVLDFGSGAANKRTAEKIADALKVAFQKQGWI